MTVEDALSQVETRLAQIERKNGDKELRPWDANACADASEHWGLTQQRLALRGNLGAICLASLGVERPERTSAQKAAAVKNGARLASKAA